LEKIKPNWKESHGKFWYASELSDRFKRKAQKTSEPPMREIRAVQSSIFETYGAHAKGLELKTMAARLDDNPQVLDWVAAEVRTPDVEDAGRNGLSCWIGAALRDSQTVRTIELPRVGILSAGFRHLPGIRALTEELLSEESRAAETISAIGDVTWEGINLSLWDGVHVLVRLLEESEELAVEPGVIQYRNPRWWWSSAETYLGCGPVATMPRGYR
jgi:hypothetical protein